MRLYYFTKCNSLFGRVCSYVLTFVLVLSMALGCVVLPQRVSTSVKAATTAKYRNVMYYGDWSIYSGQKNFTPDKIDGSLITHLNFAFMDADANGAYNIARKGLMFIDIIKETEDKNLKMPKLFIKNKDWLNYVQKSDL